MAGLKNLDIAARPTRIRRDTDKAFETSLRSGETSTS